MGVFFAEECILIFAPFFQSLACVFLHHQPTYSTITNHNVSTTLHRLTSLAPIATYNKWLMGDGDGLDRLAAMQWQVHRYICTNEPAVLMVNGPLRI